MLQVSEKEIINRFIFDNPWWENNAVDERFVNFPRRSYFPLFEKLVKDKSVNRAIILMGPRRVGKTVMVYHTIDGLLHGSVNGKAILYVSLETPIFTGLSLDKLIALFKEHFNHQRDDDLFIFFDEIQYLKNWEVHLKSLVDSYPAYRFVATGSAAAALRLKSSESGAGRFSDFMLPPLTFAEYLRFINLEEELLQIVKVEKEDDTSEEYKVIDIDKLNKEFVKYLNYGGYPEAVFSLTIQTDSARFIKSDIIDKVLLRDLPSLYGINDIQELNRLFTTIAYNTGNEITLEALAQTSGVAKNTLKRYLEYLEAAFLIRRVNRIDQNARHFKRVTSFKVYLTNPSMRAALFGYIDESNDALGALTETAIYGQWLHSDFIDSLYYSRWNSGEVDIVALGSKSQKPYWCVEVKWSDRPLIDPSLLSNVIDFAKRNSIRTPVTVTTKTKSGSISMSGVDIKFRPSSEYAYVLGKNILKIKSLPGNIA